MPVCASIFKWWLLFSSYSLSIFLQHTSNIIVPNQEVSTTDPSQNIPLLIPSTLCFNIIPHQLPPRFPLFMYHILNSDTFHHVLSPGGPQDCSDYRKGLWILKSVLINHFKKLLQVARQFPSDFPLCLLRTAILTESNNIMCASICLRTPDCLLYCLRGLLKKKLY